MSLRIIAALILLATLADCRYSFFNAIEKRLHDAPELKCKGAWHNCCTKANPCTLGDGDCDKDEECAGGLVCGENNCPQFGETKDCCTQRCKGAWHNCCTPSKPCGLHDGDCDEHSDCSGNLICGNNNCPKGWGKTKDCCDKPGKPTCNGKWHNCCTSEKKCGLGDGDCDNDEDCDGDLVCGTNNCPASWGETKDCCKKKGAPDTRFKPEDYAHDEVHFERRHVDQDEQNDEEDLDEERVDSEKLDY